MSRPKVVLAYLHPGTVRAEFMDSVQRMYREPWTSTAELSTFSARSGADITRRRNQIFQEVAGHSAFDYLWWCDSDVVFGPETLQRLLNHNLPICAALVYGQHEDGRTFPVFQAFTQQGAVVRGHATDIHDARTPFSVAGVGMACCLIARPVLDALRSSGQLWPYAEHDWQDSRGVTECDITFCLRAKDKGFETYVDPATVVGHVKDRVIWG